jgi:predicted CoA-substrate-specific enzyme activase
MRVSLGLDVGAVSTNLAVLDPKHDVIYHSYLRTEGNPIESIRRIMESADQSLREFTVAGSGTTGSGRHLAAALVGADVVKNEITAHATGTLHFFPEAQTIVEIGGQDSKIIIIRDGTVVDFGMNTVCAAGTGSFLDYQAGRMGITIEEFADIAEASKHSVRISGRCAVFAETDVIDKQQRGVRREAVAKGLCESLARNFLSSVASGKFISPPVVFQGGVAANAAVAQALENELKTEIKVPDYYNVMGAIGMAIIAERHMSKEDQTCFHGFSIEGRDLRTESFECGECSNRCEILEIFDAEVLISRWGSRCGRWDLKE